MGSQVKLDPYLEPNVFTDRERAQEVFLGSQLLLLDDVDWDADLAVIRAGLSKRRRGFKAPFQEHEPDEAVARELHRLGAHADRLFAQLYPAFTPGPRRDSFRPMITGPEPLHFDTHSVGCPMVTSFINVSEVPRVYRLGHSLPQLVALWPDLIREIVRSECKSGDVEDLSFRLRVRTMQDDRPPLGKTAPRHRVEFAPGAIWFFCAKTVSHEVVYGTGAMSFSWPLPNLDNPSQRNIVAPVL